MHLFLNVCICAKGEMLSLFSIVVQWLAILAQQWVFSHPAGEGPVCVQFTCSPHSF